MDEVKLSEADEAFLDRLFGPRIPEEMAGAYEQDRAVSFDDIGNAADALSVLVASILHNGLGGGFPAGWGLYEQNGRIVVAVYRFADLGRNAA